MSKQTEDWRGLCSVLHDLAKKFQNYHVKASAALDCASEEILKICSCLDKSEAKVADLEAVQQVLGPHDDRTGDKYGPCATCGISPEIVADRVLSARERGDLALNHVAELEGKLESLRSDYKRHVKEMQEIVAVLAGRRAVSLSIVSGGVSRLFERGKTLQTRLDELELELIKLQEEIDEDSEEQFAVAKVLDRFEGTTILHQAQAASDAEVTLRAKGVELTKENELLKAELKKRVPMHFSGEISPEVDPDPDAGETETSND